MFMVLRLLMMDIIFMVLVDFFGLCFCANLVLFRMSSLFYNSHIFCHSYVFLHWHLFEPIYTHSSLEVQMHQICVHSCFLQSLFPYLPFASWQTTLLVLVDFFQCFMIPLELMPCFIISFLGLYFCG